MLTMPRLTNNIEDNLCDACYEESETFYTFSPFKICGDCAVSPPHSERWERNRELAYNENLYLV